jgi:tRNA-intron endonuclease
VERVGEFQFDVGDTRGGAEYAVDRASPRIAVTPEHRRVAIAARWFDRRLRVYTVLREAGVVPKTGYKFGADFRTYADVESVSELSHSELLVRVVPAGHTFAPRDLALDVRLAGGVRKRMVFALVGENIEWLSAERLTP